MAAGLAAAITLAAANAHAGGELSAGWEGDAVRGYAYCSPSFAIGALTWSTVTISASDLYYSYATPTGEIRVQSPGVAIGPDLRLLRGATSMRLGADLEVRYESQTSDSATTRAWRDGPLVLFDLYHGGDLLITSIDASYGGASHYLWTRVEALRTLAPSDLALVPAIGLEATAQGNVDTRSFTGGVLAQVTPRGVDAALQLRLERSAPSLGARDWQTSVHAGVSFYGAFGR